MMSKKTAYLFTQTIFTLLTVYLTFLLLRYPAQSLSYASIGLFLWLERMIPTLLPFMILSGMMIRLNLTERFAKFFHPLFHRLFGTSLNGSYVIFMGMLCGFPMGARVIGELVNAGKLSEQEAAFLLAFCNNIGPIYFLSFVMNTLQLGGHYLPLCIMYGVPLLYGCFLSHTFYRTIRLTNQTLYPPQPDRFPSKKKEDSPSVLAALDASILSGLIGISRLGGYMIFFNLLNIMLYPLNKLPESILHFCNCMLEITSGISSVNTKGTTMVLILLPFGGFSCMAQTYSMLQNTNLSLSLYFLHKCIQTICTALIYIFAAFFCAYSF